ncbi:SusD family protein [Pedobacter sp. ok626]|uniref:RagB/SusD family nutrient uptake outer membrane protein n=1 Tax=Pedobacter sp. ok626 TaxID=1761882 RepID=UPI00088AC1FE|nr:RagB/SusD family nutrient uptake outer membrane protein [Pedobacter sp. ok626]SDL10467.1 SusD family protein [Pedobacter sp. ok626]
MYNIKNIINIFSIVLLMLLAAGCKKFVEIDPPKGEIIKAEAFKEDNAATSAVLGIYVNMLSNFSFENSGITIYSGLAADELEDFQQTTDGVQFQRNQLQPLNDVVSSMWTGAYKTIALINTCIEGLEQSNTLTPALKNQLLGECKFSRAFVYFYLVNLWKDVPLVLTSDWRVNAVITQRPENEVYAKIIEDLTNAQTLLQENYPTEGRVRPNKWAATALLARVYLYNKDYANAEAAASATIGSGTYLPLPALDQAFLRESQEAIWQLMPTKNLVLTTQEGYAFIGDVDFGLPPNYTLTASLLNSFDAADQRKTTWVNSVVYENNTYTYPFKYKDRGDFFDTNPSEYYIMLRLSEQYLIRAEARAALNKLEAAAEDMNVIRARAGLDDYVPVGQPAMLSAIADENRHEFFAEWGHRWLDLKRTGKVDAVMSLLKPTWKNTAALFPIPQAERELNRKLVQNEGY